MADRFDKFTERARRVVTFAQNESQRLLSNYIGTEHFLLGLLKERDGLACRILTNLGADIEELRNKTEEAAREEPFSGIGLTPQARRAIEFASDQAKSHNHFYIGTEHLLLGLLLEERGLAALVLMDSGLTLESVTAETIRLLGITPTPQVESPRPNFRTMVPPLVAQQLDELEKRVEEFLDLSRELHGYQFWQAANHIDLKNVTADVLEHLDKAPNRLSQLSKEIIDILRPVSTSV